MNISSRERERTTCLLISDSPYIYQYKYSAKGESRVQDYIHDAHKAYQRENKVSDKVYR